MPGGGEGLGRVLVELVEAGVVGLEVGDEREHRLFFAEAQEGYEAREGVDELAAHAPKRGLDVAEPELELLSVAAQRRELAADLGRLVSAGLGQYDLHDAYELLGQVDAELARFAVLHEQHHVERVQHGRDGGLRACRRVVDLAAVGCEPERVFELKTT